MSFIIEKWQLKNFSVNFTYIPKTCRNKKPRKQMEIYQTYKITHIFVTEIYERIIISKRQFFGSVKSNEAQLCKNETKFCS